MAVAILSAVSSLYKKEESKARCPSIGECQDREAGVGGLVSRERGDELGDFQGRNQERGHLKCK